MLEFKFTKSDGIEMPFYAEVDVYYQAMTPIPVPGTNGMGGLIPGPRLVGNLYCAKAPEGWEVYSGMPEDIDDMPVHTLENLEDFPRYVMFEIEDAAWLGVRG